MILVNQQQLDQVKYIIEQSTLGNHLLFNAETIKKIAQKGIHSQSLLPERLEHAEKLLEEMILKPSLQLKKHFLESLDAQTYEEVISVYLNIVQNSIKDAQDFKH